MRTTILIILLLFPVYFNSGCASTTANGFQGRIERMSDDELLSYYHGINDRIRDIDREIKSGKQHDLTEHDRVVSQQPFYFGGEGYDLVQKKNLILKELRKRRISP